ncbi:MAG: hypothetical protein GY870_14905 [archaeon]|nr:hypothetical protein [archaeon]
MGVKLGGNIYGYQIEPEILKKTRIAVDAYNTIMIFLKRNYYSKNHRNFLSTPAEIVTDRTQRAISHLYGIFYRTIKLLEGGILPIYCFDGISDPMKHLDTKNKINDFKKTKKKYEKALNEYDKNTARKIALGREFLWKNAIKETRELLIAMGIPFINSPTEGEAQCSQLVKMGICQYTASMDFDSLLYGSKRLLRIHGFKGKNLHGTVYELNSILKQLGLNRFQLIDLSILIGNDYFSGIKSIGIKTGIKLLQKYGNLENIIDNPNDKTKIIKNSISLEKIKKIRKLFLIPDVIKSFPEITLNFPNRGGIMNLMCYDHSLSQNRVINGINRLVKVYNTLV